MTHRLLGRLTSSVAGAAVGLITIAVALVLACGGPAADPPPPTAPTVPTVAAVGPADAAVAPTAAVAPARLVVVARLLDPGPDTPGCGYVMFWSAARYQVLSVEVGSLAATEILVDRSCPRETLMGRTGMVERLELIAPTGRVRLAAPDVPHFEAAPASAVDAAPLAPLPIP